MNWNYRIIQMEDWTLSMREVHYEDWEPTMYDDAHTTYYSGIEDMQNSFNLMRQAFDRPIINVKDIK